jgi:hypothetical protein
LHDAKRQRIEINSDIQKQPHAEDDARLDHLSPQQSPWHVEQDEVKAGMEERTERKSDLSPCHICRRKPTVKSELDAFADCDGCGERTCWICIRECAGLGVMLNVEVEGMGIEVESGQFSVEFEVEKGQDERGRLESDLGGGTKRQKEGMVRKHKRMVCSRCCVERGTEGEVWCLGCLMAEERG